MKTQKKHTGKSYMRIIGMMLCLAVFLFASWNVLDIREEYREANETYEEAAEQFAEVPEPDIESAGPDLPKIDFEGLLEINDDIVGWIYIEGTDVNYPVLKGIDNDQYLFQSYKKKYLTAGSIYIDYRCSADFSDKHMVVYGHNMKNGTMFGQMDKYKTEEYLKEHSYVYIILPDGTWKKYQVFGAYIADVFGPTFSLPAKDEVEMYNLRKLIKQENQIKTPPVIPADGQKLMTLSTCTEDSDDYNRFVISCVLVEEGKNN